MSLVCAISGVAPEDPVLAPSGHLFEKRIILKALENASENPLTGEILTPDDLIPVQTTKIVKPRPVTASSLPGLLTLFQNEWDATMAETFALRQHTEQVRQQLSHTLYQHDASCRVIARLIKERDLALTRASQLQERLNSIEASGAGGIEAETGLSDECLREVVRLARELPAIRKQRNANPPYAIDNFKEMSCVGSYPLHQTTQPGVTCCAVDPKSSSKGIVASGGVDGVVVLFDVAQRKTRSKLVGHMRRINDVAFHSKESTIVTASDDKTARVWRRMDDDDDSYQHCCAHTYKAHMGGVLDVSIHPFGSFFATCGRDSMWALHDIVSGSTLRTDKSQNVEYRCLEFHPDGPIIGLGSEDGSVSIWDVKSKSPAVMATLSEHKAAVKALAFSENGFHLATASDDGTVKLWDLRRSLVFQTLTCKQSDNAAATPLNAVKFDYSGNFIAAASSDLIHLFHMAAKTVAEEATTLSGHDGIVTDVCFGQDAEYIISSSMDRTVKLWRPNLA